MIRRVVSRRRILKLRNLLEAERVTRLLRQERTGGILVMLAALLGFICANSPLAGGYEALRSFEFGPEELHLHLSVGQWASDGLLAVFFFIVGLELKQEFVTGELRRFSTAVVPIVAAAGGVAVPALLYTLVNHGGPGEHGWAIPTATDIAFAVAVLGVIAPRVPPALRMFLLTLAVVDDLIAIVIIAVFYTGEIHWVPLMLALVPLVAFAVLARLLPLWLSKSAWGPWVLLLPLGVVTWALVHAGGIHATIAGVLLAFTVPVSGRKDSAPAHAFAWRFQPLSSGFAVPVFAFFAAGVAVGGESRFPFDPVALGVMLGLVVGKPVGISLATWLLTRFTRAELDESVRWRELIGVAALAGVGFTVALLLAELSFTSEAEADTARLAVMCGSLLAVIVAAALLVRKPQAHKQPALPAASD